MNKQLAEEVRLVSLGRGRPVAVIDFDGVQNEINERNRKHAEEHPPRPDTRELDELVQRHFDLKQDARHWEIQVNESAGKIRNCEDRIKVTKKLIDKCESPLGKSNYQAALRRLETTELIDLKNELLRHRRENQKAVDALRAFEAEQLPRLEQLRKEQK